MDLEIVRKIMQDYCDKNDLSLYDIKFVREYGYLTLQVLIDKKGGIDVDTLALANDYLSSKLDQYDKDMEEYMLEVSSPGAEKALRNASEVAESVSKYVHVEIDKMVYEGYLEGFKDNILTLKINLKGRIKMVNISYDDVLKIRLAVKI